MIWQAVAIAYFALFAIAVVIRALVGYIEHFLRNRRRRTTVSSTSESERPSHIVVLIHGTWAQNAAWTLPGSRLRKAVQEILGPAVLFERFHWSGRNRFSARSNASHDLALLVRELQQRFASVPIVFIAHSHGGNIVMDALTQLPTHERIGGVVCLSTPFLIAEHRELGTVGKVALWGAPGGLFYQAVVMVSMWILGPNREPPAVVLIGSMIGSIIVGIWAKRYAEANAKKLVQSLNYRLPSTADILIIRTPGDEASSSLNAASLLSVAVERVYQYFASPLLETAVWLKKLRLRVFAKPWRAFWIFAATLVLAIFAMIVGSDQSNSLIHGLLPAIGMTLLAIPVLMILLWSEGGLAFYILKYAVSALAVVPLGLLLAIFAIPLGPELALSALLLHVSAEPLPFGSFTITMVPSATAETDARGVPGLKHSRTYESPGALAALQKWLLQRTFS